MLKNRQSFCFSSRDMNRKSGVARVGLALGLMFIGALGANAQSNPATVVTECGVVNFPASESCDLNLGNDYMEACTGLEYAGKSKTSTDTDDLKDANFRKFFAVQMVNIKNRPITCRLTYNGLSSVVEYDSSLQVATDYCAPSLIDSKPTTSEQESRTIVLDSCSVSAQRSTLSTKFQTRKFKSKYDLTWEAGTSRLLAAEGPWPIYCPNNSGVSIDCNIGCTNPGEIEVDGTCKPGCYDKNGGFRAEGAAWDDMVHGGQGASCSRLPMKCENGVVKSNGNQFDGILQGNECVNKCYFDGIFRDNGSSWTKDNWEYPQGQSAGSACNAIRTEYRCSNTSITPSPGGQSFSGFLDYSNVCRDGCDVSGVMGGSRKLGFGESADIPNSRFSRTEVIGRKRHTCYYYKTMACETTGAKQTSRRDYCVAEGAVDNH